MLITENYAKAIRRKQADMQLTAKQAGAQDWGEPYHLQEVTFRRGSQSKDF